MSSERNPPLLCFRCLRITQSRMRPLASLGDCEERADHRKSSNYLHLTRSSEKSPPKGGAFFCLRASDGSAEIAADATGRLPLIFVPLPWRNCACRAASVHAHESRRRVQSGFYLNFGQQLREMRAPHPP